MSHAARSSRRRSLAVAILVMATLTLGACEQKISQANLDQVREGMSYADVTRLLGSGTKEAKAEGGSIAGVGVLDNRGNASPDDTYVWRDGGAEIVITFRDGKVQSKVGRNLP